MSAASGSAILLKVRGGHLAPAWLVEINPLLRQQYLKRRKDLSKVHASAGAERAHIFMPIYGCM